MVSTSVPFISPILGSKYPIWDYFLIESVRGPAFTLNRPLSPDLQSGIESFVALTPFFTLSLIMKEWYR